MVLRKPPSPLSPLRQFSEFAQQERPRVRSILLNASKKEAQKGQNGFGKWVVPGLIGCATLGGGYLLYKSDDAKQKVFNFFEPKVLTIQCRMMLKGFIRGSWYNPPYLNYRFQIPSFREGIVVQDVKRIEGSGFTVTDIKTNFSQDVQCAQIMPNEKLFLKTNSKIRDAFLRLPLFSLILQNMQHPRDLSSKLVHQELIKSETSDESDLYFAVIAIPVHKEAEMNSMLAPSNRGLLFFTANGWAYAFSAYTLDNKPAPPSKETVERLRAQMLKMKSHFETTPQKDVKRIAELQRTKAFNSKQP